MKLQSNFLIIEDSLIFIQGLKSLLEPKDFTKEIHAAQNIKEALGILKNNQIGVVILDLNFESESYNGFIIANKIRQLYPEMKILVLTEHVRVFIHNKLFGECKVNAYVDKQLGYEHLHLAIESILKGEIYIDPNIEEMIKVGERMKISKREKDVMPYLIEGFTQKEIGDKLFLSKRTVEKHIENIARKFGVKRTVPLVVHYLQYIFSKRENSGGGINP